MPVLSVASGEGVSGPKGGQEQEFNDICGGRESPCFGPRYSSAGYIPCSPKTNLIPDHVKNKTTPGQNGVISNKIGDQPLWSGSVPNQSGRLPN